MAIDDLETWRTILNDAMKLVGDLGPVVTYAPDEAAFNVAFDSGYGSSNGPDVLAWTETRVYFPVVYDGAEWLGSAPRNPTAHGQAHEGGQ